MSADGYTSTTFSVTLAIGQTLTKDVELDRTGSAVLASLLVPILVIILIAALGLVFLVWSRRKQGGEKS